MQNATICTLKSRGRYPCRERAVKHGTGGSSTGRITARDGPCLPLLDLLSEDPRASWSAGELPDIHQRKANQVEKISKRLSDRFGARFFVSAKIFVHGDVYEARGLSPFFHLNKNASIVTRQHRSLASIRTHLNLALCSPHRPLA